MDVYRYLQFVEILKSHDRQIWNLQISVCFFGGPSDS